MNIYFSICKHVSVCIKISITFTESAFWPAGSYGIPKAASGCPYADGFQWLIGRIYQDTENNGPNSYASCNLHLDATVSKTDIERSFCMKTTNSTAIKRKLWPKGNAMIYFCSQHIVGKNYLLLFLSDWLQVNTAFTKKAAPALPTCQMDLSNGTTKTTAMGTANWEHFLMVNIPEIQRLNFAVEQTAIKANLSLFPPRRHFSCWLMVQPNVSR